MANKNLKEEKTIEVTSTEEVKLEEAVDTWEDNVRTEIARVFDNLLPISSTGCIQVKYRDLVLMQTEAGPMYDNTKVSGVDVLISFDFVDSFDKEKMLSKVAE